MHLYVQKLNSGPPDMVHDTKVWKVLDDADITDSSRDKFTPKKQGECKKYSVGYV